MNDDYLRPAPSESNIDLRNLNYLGLDQAALLFPIISTHFGLDAADAARAILEASMYRAAAE